MRPGCGFGEVIATCSRSGKKRRDNIGTGGGGGTHDRGAGLGGVCGTGGCCREVVGKAGAAGCHSCSLAHHQRREFSLLDHFHALWFCPSRLSCACVIVIDLYTCR